MSDKEFDEWLRSTRPRPGAGSYPAVPIEIPALIFDESVESKQKRGRGRPKGDKEKSEQKIKMILAGHDFTKKISLYSLWPEIDKKMGYQPGSAERNHKEFIKKTIDEMRGKGCKK
jgi:hypothetical protein